MLTRIGGVERNLYEGHALFTKRNFCIVLDNPQLPTPTPATAHASRCYVNLKHNAFSLK